MYLGRSFNDPLYAVTSRPGDNGEPAGSHITKSTAQRDLSRRRVVAVNGKRVRYAADWSLFGFTAALRMPLLPAPLRR